MEGGGCLVSGFVGREEDFAGAEDSVGGGAVFGTFCDDDEVSLGDFLVDIRVIALTVHGVPGVGVLGIGRDAHLVIVVFLFLDTVPHGLSPLGLSGLGLGGTFIGEFVEVVAAVEVGHGLCFL